MWCHAVQVFLRNLPYKLVAADVGETLTELCGEVCGLHPLIGVAQGSACVDLIDGIV